MIKLLLLSGNSEAVAACQKALEARGVHCAWAGSVADMHRQLLSTPFNGLILDVLTTARTSPKDRALLQEVSDYYPTLLMRWSTAAQKVRGLVFGEILDKDDPLGDFVTRFCRPERCLSYRENRRYNIHFNVLLSDEQDFSEELVEKTVTLYLSRGGCFIISSRNWQNMDRAWIRLLELADPSPIQVQLCRYLAWGEQARIPGISVKFMNLPPGQQQEIHRYCDDPQP
jgi:hypothetical protein